MSEWGLSHGTWHVTIDKSTSNTRACGHCSSEGTHTTTSLVPRIRRVLSDLDAAVGPRDLDMPGYRLHRLTGDRRGYWSVRVSGNWRILFRFVNGEVADVDLLDYH